MHAAATAISFTRTAGPAPRPRRDRRAKERPRHHSAVHAERAADLCVYLFMRSPHAIAFVGPETIRFVVVFDALVGNRPSGKHMLVRRPRVCSPARPNAVRYSLLKRTAAAAPECA